MSGDSFDNWVDPTDAAANRADAQRRAAYTAANRMSREDFLRKYGTTFVADDRGGNAASEVAGQDVGAYYDQYLADGATGDSSGFGWKYRDANPYFDAWDNVDPHPESQDLGGFGEAWRQIGRPAAMAGLGYLGVNALGGLLGGAGAAGSTTGVAAGGGVNAGMTLAEQYAAYGAGGGGVTGAGTAGYAGTAATAAGTGFTGSMVMPELAGSMPAGVTEFSSMIPTAEAGTGFLTEAGTLGGATTAGGAMIGTGTAAEGAAAITAAQGGASFASLARTYGPTIARVALAALAGGAGQGGSGGSGGGAGGGSADIDSLISGALGNTQAMQQWYEPRLQWADQQVGQITQRGNEGYDQLMGMSRAPNRNIDDYQAYLDRIGSQGYRDQQRGMAMGEVQQQADGGLAQARRAAMARGIDPAKFALQQNANSINTAAAKTKAAADAEGMAWDQWGKGSEVGANMRIADTTSRANLVKGANEVGQMGLNAGLRLAAVDSAYRGGINNNFTNMANSRTSNASAQAGLTRANNEQNNYDREHSIGGIINAGLTTGITNWAFGNGTAGNTGAIGNLFGG